MALEANNVFATFGVKTAEWSKGLAKMLGDTSKTLKQIEGIGSKFGGIGIGFAASIGLAMREAAKTSEPLKASLAQVSTSMTAMTSQLGDAFAPAFAKVAAVVKSVSDTFAQLNPRLQEAFGSFALGGTAVLLAVGMLGKLSGGAAAVAEAMKMVAVSFATASGSGNQFITSVLPKMAAMALPVLAVVAALAAMALAFGAVYAAWEDTSTGLQDGVAELWKDIKLLGEKVAGFFKELFDGVKGFIEKGLLFILDGIASALSGIGTILKKASSLPGMGWLQDVGNSLEGMTGGSLLKGVKNAAGAVASVVKTGVGAVVDGAIAVGKNVGESLAYSAKGLVKAAKDASKYLPDFGAMLGGGKAKALPGKGGEKPEPQETYYGPGSSAGMHAPGTSAAVDGALAEFQTMSDGWAAAGAQGAKDATEAFSESWDRFHEGVERSEAETRAATEAARPKLEAQASMKNKAIGATGEGGQLAMNAVEGAAAGGPMGAFMAVIMDLISKSEVFMELIGMVSNFIGEIANVVGSILMPVLEPLAVVFQIVSDVIALFQPALEMLLSPLEMLTPLLGLVGLFMATMAPIIQSLISQALMPLNIAMALLGPVIDALFKVIRPVLQGISWVVGKIAGVYNGFVEFVASIFDKLSKIPIIGKYFGKIATTLRKTKVDLENMNEAQSVLADATIESTKAIGAEAKARYDSTESIKEFSGALENMSQAFKYDAIRYSVMDFASLPAPPMPPPGAAPIAPMIPPVNNFNITGGDKSAAEIAEEIARVQARERARRAGSAKFGAKNGKDMDIP